MNKFEQLYRQLENITEEVVEQKLLELIRKNEAFIVDLNISQMLLGKDSEGNTIGAYRSALYEAFKKQKNPQAGGNVDLNLTGDFQNAMYVEADKFPVTIDSKDSKRDKLVDQYGDKFFNLQTGNKVLLAEHLKEEFEDWFASLIKV